jgi:hypothetical protein
MDATASSIERDDRVLPAMHWASLVIVAILIPALVILWGLPSRTADLWAWSGHAPFVGAAVFFGWVIVYIVSPVAVGWLWFVNQQRDPRQREPGDPIVPPFARGVALAIGVAAIAAGAVFFASPSTMADLWPWALTPLTARVLACFTIQVGLGALLLSRDLRWSSWRLLLQTVLVAVALLAVGTARSWDDFDTGDAATWLFIGGLAGLVVAILALYTRMSGASR